MKNLSTNLLVKFGGLFAALALLVTTTQVNTYCRLVINQPKIPACANKLKKDNENC